MSYRHPIKNHEYRQSIGLSQSTLKAFAACPALVPHVEAEAKKPPTPAQALGLVTEAKLFGISFDYVVSPFDSYRTNEAKDWRAKQHAANVIPITQDADEKSTAMVAALRANPTISQLIAKGRASAAIWQPDPATGIIKRALYDFIPDTQFMLDLKTCSDASEHGFARQVASLGYDIQDAYYTDMFEAEFHESRRFVFICVESEAPHLTSTWTIPESNRQIAREKIRLWLDAYKRCQDSGRWPSYTSAVTEIRMPKYSEFVQPVQV